MIACHFNKTQLLNMDLDVSQNQIQRARDINRSNKATLHEYKRTMPESKKKLRFQKLKRLSRLTLNILKFHLILLKKPKKFLVFKLRDMILKKIIY